MILTYLNDFLSQNKGMTVQGATLVRLLACLLACLQGQQGQLGLRERTGTAPLPCRWPTRPPAH